MTQYTDDSTWKSGETVFNNSTRNCVVKEEVIPGKAGYQISISEVGIDLANEKTGVVTTCNVTVESEKREQYLAKWVNSKDGYESLTASYEYSAPVGCDAKIRVSLKTGDKNYNALARRLWITWEYITTDGGESEPVQEDDQETVDEPVSENDTVLVVRCSSGAVDALVTKIQQLAPTAELKTLQML